jgi:hypothetical protein
MDLRDVLTTDSARRWVPIYPQIAAGFNSGMTCSEVAKAFGLPSRSAAASVRRKLVARGMVPALENAGGWPPRYAVVRPTAVLPRNVTRASNGVSLPMIGGLA